VVGERDHDHPGADRPENHVRELRHAGAPLRDERVPSNDLPELVARSRSRTWNHLQRRTG
jgi:hypothetical protein